MSTVNDGTATTSVFSYIFQQSYQLDALRHTMNSEITIIMGDLNAKVGSEAVDNLVGSYGLGDKNDRGELLIDFCQEYNFVVTNTWFKHPT